MRGRALHAESVRATWRHAGTPGRATPRDLVHYATLAASSHNTQPWRFRVAPDGVTIVPDLTRRCPAVDPDDHHLYASLGCAAENLVIAARTLGWTPTVACEPAPDGATHVVVRLAPAAPAPHPLFEALLARQCSRTRYDGRAVPLADLGRLAAAGRGDGVEVRLLTAPADLERIAGFVAEGDLAQVGDRGWVRELRDWIRFDAREAAVTRDGLYAGASGNPELPRPLGVLALPFALRPARQAARDAEDVRSAAGVAVLVSARDDVRHWVEAGRCAERLQLQAATLGIATAFVNQPVESVPRRARFAAALGIPAGRPDLVLRFGYGPALARSLRRPVEDVVD